MTISTEARRNFEFVSEEFFRREGSQERCFKCLWNENISGMEVG